MNRIIATLLLATVLATLATGHPAWLLVGVCWAAAAHLLRLMTRTALTLWRTHRAEAVQAAHR